MLFIHSLLINFTPVFWQLAPPNVSFCFIICCMKKKNPEISGPDRVGAKPLGKWHLEPQKTQDIDGNCFSLLTTSVSSISFTSLLLCYLVFKHVSGCDLCSNWNRCVWIVLALFWCNCNSMHKYIWWLWWK